MKDDAGLQNADLDLLGPLGARSLFGAIGSLERRSIGAALRQLVADETGSLTLGRGLKNAATNQKLKNIIGNLFRRNAKVENGSSMDAVRLELRTGIPVGGKFHTNKLIESRNGLVKLLRNRSLDGTDREIVKSLLIDIQKALSGN